MIKELMSPHNVLPEAEVEQEYKMYMIGIELYSVTYHFGRRMTTVVTLLVLLYNLLESDKGKQEGNTSPLMPYIWNFKFCFSDLQVFWEEEGTNFH